MMDHTHPTMTTKETNCNMADNIFKPNAFAGLPSFVLQPQRQAQEDMKVPGDASDTST